MQTSGSSGSASVTKAPLCAPGTALPFDYKKAAAVKGADGKAVGADGARTLVSDLGDTDSICGVDVSADTQKVIDDAHALVQEGKKADALALINTETARVIALPTVRMFAAGVRELALAPATDKADQKARDLLALGGAAQDAGDDGAQQLAQAQAIYGPKLEARLQSADWQEAVKVAAEAQKLGLDDLAKRAQGHGGTGGVAGSPATGVPDEHGSTGGIRAVVHRVNSSLCAANGRCLLSRPIRPVVAGHSGASPA